MRPQRGSIVSWLVYARTRRTSSVARVVLSLNFPLFTHSVTHTTCSSDKIDSSISSSVSGPDEKESLCFRATHSLYARRHPTYFRHQKLDSGNEQSVLSIIDSPFFRGFADSIDGL